MCPCRTHLIQEPTHAHTHTHTYTHIQHTCALVARTSSKSTAGYLTPTTCFGSSDTMPTGAGAAAPPAIAFMLKGVCGGAGTGAAALAAGAVEVPVISEDAVGAAVEFGAAADAAPDAVGFDAAAVAAPAAAGFGAADGAMW